VRVAGGVEPEQPRDEQLTRGRVEQVVAAHDLADPLVGVVDDDREVVRRRAVVAPQHEVVDDGLDRSVDAVDEADPLGAGVESQRGRAAGGLAPGALRRGQAPARPGVGAFGQRAVRG
jgi:hypothetical protein